MSLLLVKEMSLLQKINEIKKDAHYQKKNNFLTK